MLNVSGIFFPNKSNLSYFRFRLIFIFYKEELEELHCLSALVCNFTITRNEIKTTSSKSISVKCFICTFGLIGLLWKHLYIWKHLLGTSLTKFCTIVFLLFCYNIAKIKCS